MKQLSLLLLLAASMAKADIPSTHGMLVFGNKSTYASHLPMFHSPHDYQLVMKISFSDGPQALNAFAAVKAQGEQMFTIEPEVMDLTKVMSGEIKAFKAKLYQGHFERGGKQLGPVTVHVEQFIVNTKLNPAAPELNQYIVFGEIGETFIVHLINGKPSFDLVAKAPLLRGPFPMTLFLPDKPKDPIYFEEQELH